jgi:hypothetical protein
MIDKEILRRFSEGLVERHREHQAKRDAVEGEDMVFVLPPYEQFTLAKWLVEHKKTCKLRFEKDGSPKMFPGGAAGGSLTYCFTPTGIGMAQIVKCGCGEEINVTDYDQW